MIYIIIIFLPVLCAYFSDKSNKYVSLFFALLAISFPIFFAGVRDASVGNDVQVYATNLFKKATTLDFVSFMSFESVYHAFGINLLTWIVCRLNSFSIYLGFIQLLVIAPIFFFVYVKYPKNTWIAMAVYMLLLFPISLSTMKQMIAVAWCFPCIGLLEKNKYKLVIFIVILISMLIHMTAVFYLLIVPIFWLLKNLNSTKLNFLGNLRKYSPLILLFIYFIVLFIGAKFFINLLSGLKESYSFFLNTGKQSINKSCLFMVLFLIFSLIVYSVKNKDKKIYWLFTHQQVFCVICIFAFSLFQLDMIANTLDRFAFYFLPFMTIYASSLLNTKPKKLKILLSLSNLIVLSIYFFVVCVLNTGYLIYPYTSKILGIY